MIITSRNNASISNFVGGFRWKSEYPWCIIEVKNKHFPTVFKKIENNKIKMTEKRQFLRKTSFRPNRFFYMVVIQKLITVKFLRNLSKTRKFAMRLNFKFLRNRVTITIYPQTILNICYYSKSISRRYLKILPIKFFWPNQNTCKFLYKVPHMHNFFLFAFEVQILTKIRQNYEYLQIILPLKHKPPFSPTTGNYILG
ncbi:hypothetical protein AGLY_009313 [Aphis glycines]|uniref:Uncharacterized protein n=1 Tax=Aphis glycines TaxID=307491 RepID=A0A6G0TI43_APHGL|nr:hypothetical protein AGLY_009313 [Aphis glycines]